MEAEDLTPDCGRMRSELTGYLYGELALDARSALERHLEGCAACREELAALRETRALLARWETPPAGDDPRVLAARIAAAARREEIRPAPSAPRARLVRWSAVLSGAAAAVLFTLSVLGARIDVRDGQVEIGFALPGSGRAGEPIAADDVRALVAQEVALRTSHLEQSQEELFQRVLQMNKEELLRLAQTVDYALNKRDETWNTRFTSLTREAFGADLQTWRALDTLATAVSQPANR